jgi:hypothetical protein
MVVDPVEGGSPVPLLLDADDDDDDGERERERERLGADGRDPEVAVLAGLALQVAGLDDDNEP